MWRPQDEEKDFADYSGLVRDGLCKGNILEWKDVETQFGLSRPFGIIRYAASLCGADLGTIEGSVHKLQKLMLEAGQGSQGALAPCRKICL
jgi:hypothetical protein